MKLTHLAKDLALYKEILKRKALFVPYIIFAVFCILWSIAWVYGKGKVEARLNGMKALSCGTKTVSGYPFRYDVKCDGLKLQQNGLISAKDAVFTARFFSPNHFIGEVSSPVTYETLKIEAKSILLSASKRDDNRFSLVMENARFFMEDALKATSEKLDLQFFEKEALGETGKQQIFITLDKFDAPFYQRKNVLLSLELDTTPAFIAGRKNFKRWLNEGGALKLMPLKLEADDFIAAIEGTIIAQNGVLNGDLSLKSVNLPQEINKFASLGQWSQLLRFMGKRIDYNGKEAVEFPFSIKENRLMVGGFPIFSLPSF